MLHLLKHFKLIVDHLFIASNILLEDYLDSNLAIGTVGFSNDAIGTSTECPAKTVPRSVAIIIRNERHVVRRVGGGLLVVAVRLAVQPVHHA